jgi:hypothetical protein
MSKKTDRIIAGILGAAVLLLMLFSLGSCSANWHLKRALIKDPSLAIKKQPIIKVLEAQPVTALFDCDSAKLNGVTLVLPREYKTIAGRLRVDTVLLFVKGDTIRIHCPDAIETICPDPQVLKVKATFWQKAEYFGAGIICLIFVSLLIRIFKR